MSELFGLNPIKEALKNQLEFNKIWIAKKSTHKGIEEVCRLAKKAHIPIQEVERSQIEKRFPKENHQGIYASLAEIKYAEVEEILALAEERGEAPFVVLLDEIEDPHNLGAIIRNVEAFGAHGIILPKRRSALATATVAKASAGAMSMVKIARVSNLVQTIEKLKKAGLWICGTDMSGDSLYQADLSGALAVIIGSEGSGMRDLTKKHCDFMLSIPMRGQINSLNASVASGIVLSEIAKGR